MERAELAARLVAADDAGRAALLSDHAALVDVRLAYTLKDICLEDWSSEPARTIASAEALKTLARLINNPEVDALHEWVAGFAAVVSGQIEQAVALLEDSEARFLALSKPHIAASTQVIKLYALALLGRYDEAIECGLCARSVLLAHNDLQAAGKIEHNIGNIYLRRDRYEEAERFQLLARARFAALGDLKQLAKIDNNLAIIYSSQHKFRSAEKLYNQALVSAEAAGLSVTQAEIEASMGNLALFQGRYDRALDLLERSRRRYAALGMPHQSAVAEQELADAYLDLNMANEAAEVYQRITPMFAALGMQGERARTLAHHGRAAILLGQMDKAHSLLAEARRLYAAEGNPVGEAMVTLTEAQLHYAEGSYQAASVAAHEAEAPLTTAGTWRHTLMARWLRGETARKMGETEEARTLLKSTLRDAELQFQPQVAQRCHTSFGQLALSVGNAEAAEASFKRAVCLIEDLRAPLPAEEFRTAFFADKLVPYNELVRLCLGDGREDRIVEALCYVERARSRSLVDLLGGALKLRAQPRDSFEAEQLAKLEELREELNWFYSQINRPTRDDSAQRAINIAALQEAVRERERRTMEIMRQLQQRGEGTWTQVETLDIVRLKSALGAETALIEYTTLDGELLAFVVTDEGVSFVRNLSREAEAVALVEQFRFQVDALRYGAAGMRKHLTPLTERIRHHLHRLYDLLLRPLEGLIGGRRLMVVPHRALHYIPFHALHDRKAYVIEHSEVVYAPSAVVLLHCLARPKHALRSALLLGVADEQTPRVADEIKALAPLFPEAMALVNESATVEALNRLSPRADLLHLACHGQFRPDNPLFSSLRLGDRWLTARDAYDLNLNCELVALSACETGINEVAPGDELIGLTRGFFSAGAPSLLLSLWTVDDQTTADLMTGFYRRLLDNQAPASALRSAQLEALERQPHPFFWSPFMLMGRW
jgi:CHAT domain-containing protein